MRFLLIRALQGPGLAWLTLLLALASARQQSCEPSQLGYQCRLRAPFPPADGWIHYTWDTEDGPPNNVCSGSGGNPSPSNERVAHWAVETTASGYVSLAFAEDLPKMNPCEAVIGGVHDDSGNIYMDTYRFTTYDATPPHGPDANWGYNMGAAQEGDTTTICFTTKMPSGDSNSLPPELQKGGLLDLHWALHVDDDPSLRHREKGSLQLDPVEGTLFVLSGSSRKYVLAHSILMAITFALLFPIGIMTVRHRRLTSLANKQLGPTTLWLWTHAGLQALGTACFLAAVGIALNKFGGSYPSGSQDLGEAHRVIGILLIPLICIQLLMGILPRPKPVEGPTSSKVPKTRFIWNIIHHNWGRLSFALAIANVYIGIVLYVRIWSVESRTQDLSAWMASVTAVLGILCIVEATLTILTVYKQHRVDHSGHVEFAGPTALEKDSFFAEGKPM